MLDKIKRWRDSSFNVLGFCGTWLLENKKTIFGVIVFFSLTIPFVIYFLYPLVLLLWEGGGGSVTLLKQVSHDIGQLKFKEGVSYQPVDLYYWVNVVSPIVLILLTFLSVLGVLKTISDGTKQRKLDSIDHLINLSVKDLQDVLNSEVSPPPIIAELLGDEFSKKTKKWDIRKVVIQTNTLIGYSESLPNKRFVESVRMFLNASDFHYDSFGANLILIERYSALLDLVLMRQKIKIDTSYNNVILSFCEYLYSFLEFANHYNDDSHDEIERLHEAIDEIDTRVNLKMIITNQKTLRDLDKSFSKFDKLSCEEILSHNPPIGGLRN